MRCEYTPEPTLAQGMMLIGFGAVIGSVSTYVAARTQAGLQRRQLLLDKRLSALLEFSKVIVNGADVLHHIKELFQGRSNSTPQETISAKRAHDLWKRLAERVHQQQLLDGHGAAEVVAVVRLLLMSG